MKNILIIGCGLLGSSLLRCISKKKIAKKIFIYEKSKLNISKIKRLKLSGTIVKSLKEGVINSDLIIDISPTQYGEALIYVDRDNSKRYSDALLNMKTFFPDIQKSKIQDKIFNNVRRYKENNRK